MNARFVAAVSAALILMLAAGAAWARNPHCAGGIQYLTQAVGDKAKGNLDDYSREIQKAVQQLEQCSSEDPSDFEAIGYLGWAYCLVDSFCPGGKAFETSVKGLAEKSSDKKKLEMVANNRDSFWATQFNAGITRFQDAQSLMNPYLASPSTDEEKANKEKARLDCDAAKASFTSAMCLKPGEARTLRNLGTVYAYLGDYVQAETYFNQGLASAPGDTDLVAALHQTRIGHANQLVRDKKFDEAVKYYQELLKADAKNSDLWAGLGDASLEQAHAAEGDAKKPFYTTAAGRRAKNRY